ncbi:hypothetical protein E4U09_005040 [Claviceps aff. purpurea]|uniref:BZIP domain-containing protein n=1 Tax=Claviceps aff. purpurea TaxID=1967640 RepID=A0A9P7QDE9_9HYPO|nr:hypothetical protein E4U09_005040 [Claviceps aff. purpurea]
MSGTDVVQPFELGRRQFILPIRAAPSPPADLPRRRNSAGQQTLQGTRPLWNQPGNNRRLGAHDSARESREARKKQRQNGVASTCLKKKKQSRKEIMTERLRMILISNLGLKEEIRFKDEELRRMIRQNDEEIEKLKRAIQKQIHEAKA